MQPLTFAATLLSSAQVTSAWTSHSAGNMKGVTYAGGSIYNAGTMCPSNTKQGYVCDSRNFGAEYLDPTAVSSFCSGYPGTSSQYGFGHGVTSSQKCGECAQIRVPRIDGSYNYMTVMMVDHYTWSMEVGTTEIPHLLEGTQWQVGDFANFDFRLVGDCYASFDGDSGSSVPAPTPRPTTAIVVNSPSPTTGSGGGGSSAGCKVSSNWGAMTINPYWGSSSASASFFVYNAPATISSFEIRGFGQSDAQFQSCAYQNVNFFQCNIAGGALAEPATVRLNGVYYGENVIESMTGSSAQYGAATCASGSAYTDEDDHGDDKKDGAVSPAAIVAVVLCCLVCVLGVCWAWRWRVRSKRGTAYFKEDVDAVETTNAPVEQDDTTEIVLEAEAEAGADDTTQMMPEAQAQAETVNV